MKNKKKIFLKRKIIFKNYKKELDNNKFIIQKINSKSDFVPWTQAIYFKNKKINYERISYHLMKKGIETRNGFYSANRLPIYKVNKLKINNSDFLSRNIICLPIFYDLKKDEIKKICNYLNHMIQ
jgi:dTDP-4-amino-4,6-dideoxygalactose transaminase